MLVMDDRMIPPLPFDTLASDHITVDQDVWVDGPTAEKWLETTIRNRTAPPNAIAQLAGAMLRPGEWLDNGDTVRFDRDGHLIDGRRRLSALKRAAEIKPGFALRFIVVRGLEPEAQDTMDIGSKRTTGQIFQMHGVANSNHVAAAAQHVHGYLEGKLNRGRASDRRGTPKQLVDLVAKHFGAFDNAMHRAVMLRRQVPVTASTAAAAFFIISLPLPDETPEQMRQRAEDVADFWVRLTTGENLTAGSPINAMRKRLIREAMEPRKAPSRNILAAFIRAWNAYRDDEKLDVVVWKENQQFPRHK